MKSTAEPKRLSSGTRRANASHPASRGCEPPVLRGAEMKSNTTARGTTTGGLHPRLARCDAFTRRVPLLRRFVSAVLFTKFREWATWMATARPLSRGAHDSKHSTAEPQSRFSSGTQRITGCRRLAQRAAAPKVILPTITFGITCGRRSPLAAMINCAKPRRKRTSGGETRDRLDTSYREVR